MKKKHPDRRVTLKEIRRHYAGHRSAIRKRLREFRSVHPSEYFYELVYCFLTPQSSAVNADQAVRSLRSAGFQSSDIDPEPILKNKNHYIRFHRKKSFYLVYMKGQFPVIRRKLSEELPAGQMREWIVKNVKGIGYKEATHFLRNIGKNDRLAILDRHILRRLRELNIIHKIPVSMSKRQYLAIERDFAKFSRKIGILLDELDLIFWSMSTGEIRK